MRPNVDQALCRQPGANPEDWFRGSDTPRGRLAARTCLSCPIQAACQKYALDNGVPYGIWGGMTPEARRRHWRKHGTPHNFLADIDEAINPLLRERRVSEGLIAS